MENKDYYKILKVTKNSSKKDIIVSYKKLAKQYHPDKNKDKNSQSIFQDILEAYQILSDDDKRKKYDLEISCSKKSFTCDNSKERSNFNDDYLFKSFNCNDKKYKNQEKNDMCFEEEDIKFDSQEIFF